MQLDVHVIASSSWSHRSIFSIHLQMATGVDAQKRKNKLIFSNLLTPMAICHFKNRASWQDWELGHIDFAGVQRKNENPAQYESKHGLKRKKSNNAIDERCSTLFIWITPKYPKIKDITKLQDFRFTDGKGDASCMWCRSVVRELRIREDKREIEATYHELFANQSRTWQSWETVLLDQLREQTGGLTADSTSSCDWINWNIGHFDGLRPRAKVPG